MYVFEINPVPASRPRVSKYGTYYLPTYRMFRAGFREAIAASRDGTKKADGPLVVEVRCYVEKPKTGKRPWPNGDVDNYAKAVLDGLNGILWDDDDQIIDLRVTKEYVEIGNARIEVEVRSVKSSRKNKVSKLCRQGPRQKRRQSCGLRRRS
jgi:Holliday junction resolvase RusA-like endonuclease